MKYFKITGLLFFLFLVGCNKESDLLETTEIQLRSAPPEKSNTFYFNKTPIFNYENNELESIEYQINVAGREYKTEHKAKQIIDIMGDSPGYAWKIVEDIISFENTEFGFSKFETSRIRNLIQETNLMITKFNAKLGPNNDPCNFMIPAGAIAAAEVFISSISEDPYLLYGGEDCVEDSEYYTYWQYLFDFTVSEEVVEIIEENDPVNSVVTVLDASSGTTNMDYHAIGICEFPFYPDGTQFGPWDLFLHIRSQFYQNPFDTDCNMDFQLYPEFDDDDWNGDPLGVIFEIDVLPIESGDVVCSQDEGLQITDSNNGYNWIFSTIYGDRSGWHPVSGNRMFGMREKQNGCWEFYITGVDRLTNWRFTLFGESFPYEQADAGWDCIIEQVSELVTTLDGTVGEITSVHCRPDWEMLYESWTNYCDDPEAFNFIPPCNECF